MRQVCPSNFAAAAVFLGLTAVGCENPDLKTDLNTEGPPEVTTVLVLSESIEVDSNRDTFPDTSEVATFCGQLPGMKVHRGFCPRNDAGEVMAATPVMDAQPAAWFARVVFSELLDPSVEELIDTNPDDDRPFDTGTIAQTQPVRVVCGGREVAYGGFYDPSGNDVSGRPGPALIIEPAEQVATGSECTVTVKNTVTDKDGLSVNPEFAGPFVFGIADMAITGSSPAPGDAGVGLDAQLAVGFNAAVDGGSLTGAVTLVDADQNAVDATLEGIGTNAVVTPAAALLPGTEYTLTVNTTGVRDAGGGELTLDAPFVVSFTTASAE